MITSFRSMTRSCASILLAAGMMAASTVSDVAPALADDKLVRIDGSSTVFPITEAVAEEFQIATPGSQVTVGIAGTGGGFKRFIRNETDITDASRPISATEMEEAKKAGVGYIELPIAFDALTVVVHPSNTWVDKLTVDELKKMWEPAAQGTIKKWSQIREGFPDVEFKLYGAGSDSGTFDYFTEAIVGKSKASRGDYTASEDDNVLVQGVSGDKNALGYFGYAYYSENRGKLKAVPIVGSNGKAVEPSPEHVLDGSYQPLARPLFLYVNKASLSKPIIKSFIEFYLKQGADLITEVKYIPLPGDGYEKALARLNAGSTGTIFAGKGSVGSHAENLFTAELKS